MVGRAADRRYRPADIGGIPRMAQPEDLCASSHGHGRPRQLSPVPVALALAVIPPAQCARSAGTGSQARGRRAQYGPRVVHLCAR